MLGDGGPFTVKRFVAAMLGLLLAAAVPAAGPAQARPAFGADMTQTVRSILKRTQRPQDVARQLAAQGVRFLGYQQRTVTFQKESGGVKPVRSTLVAVGPDFEQAYQDRSLAGDVSLMAGEKADFTMTIWLYEWRDSSGRYTEQAAINGTWRSTEYRWIDDPADVIDVRWTVGDLVYLSSYPYDGVARDQHTNGIASFTVDDQVKSWDLYVNFRPVNGAVYGKWTDIFANYTQTWWVKAQKAREPWRVKRQ